MSDGRLQICRVPTWGFSITEASYYGWRWGESRSSLQMVILERP